MKVSIVIPTYNRAEHLDRLLKSVANQSFNNFEVIVVDDNSKCINGYERIIKKYNDIFKEFKFIRKNENKGAPHSRNIGILESKYDLIALVDDDDEWLPSKLEAQVSIFKNNVEKIGLVYTWTDVMDHNRDIIFKYRSQIEGNPRKEILRDCFIPSPSVMVKKKAIVDAGLFDERFPSCQDWDMWTRMIISGYDIKVLKAVVTIYHKHLGGNVGLTRRARKGYSMFYKKHMKHDFSLCFKYIRELCRW